MSILGRFKKTPEGFRAWVELLESTPIQRRERMIETCLAEDPEYTRAAMELVMNFQDILDLPEPELAEVLSAAPPKFIGLAIHQSGEDIQKHFLRLTPSQHWGVVRSQFDAKVELREIGGAQMKLIETARGLERKGLVSTKRIPLRLGQSPQPTKRKP